MAGLRAPEQAVRTAACAGLVEYDEGFPACAHAVLGLCQRQLSNLAAQVHLQVPGLPKPPAKLVQKRVDQGLPLMLNGRTSSRSRSFLTHGSLERVGSVSKRRRPSFLQDPPGDASDDVLGSPKFMERPQVAQIVTPQVRPFSTAEVTARDALVAALRGDRGTPAGRDPDPPVKIPPASLGSTAPSTGITAPSLSPRPAAEVEAAATACVKQSPQANGVSESAPGEDVVVLLVEGKPPSSNGPFSSPAAPEGASTVDPADIKADPPDTAPQGAAPPSMQDMCPGEGSSEEDTGDEAYEQLHRPYEAEEHQRFVTVAGGGAQKVSRTSSGSSKPRGAPPKKASTGLQPRHSSAALEPDSRQCMPPPPRPLSTVLSYAASPMVSPLGQPQHIASGPFSAPPLVIPLQNGTVLLAAAQAAIKNGRRAYVDDDGEKRKRGRPPGSKRAVANGPALKRSKSGLGKKASAVSRSASLPARMAVHSMPIPSPNPLHPPSGGSVILDSPLPTGGASPGNAAPATM